VEIRWGPPRGPTVRRCECDRIWMAGLVGSSVGASWFGGTMKLGLSITIGNPRLLIYILYTYMYIYIPRGNIQYFHSQDFPHCF
jgi:hypothetical protein